MVRPFSHAAADACPISVGYRIFRLAFLPKSDRPGVTKCVPVFILGRSTSMFSFGGPFFCTDFVRVWLQCCLKCLSRRDGCVRAVIRKILFDFELCAK